MEVELSRIDSADVLELRFQGVGAAGQSKSDGASLALRYRGDADRIVRVTGVQGADDRIRADLHDVPLDDGTWDVLWVDGEGRRSHIATSDSGLSLADRITYLRRPRRRELRTVRDPRGRLRLRAAAVVPYAEVEWVGVEADTVTVSGLLAYTSCGGGTTEGCVVARQRERTGSLTAPAGLAEGRFCAEIPLSLMAGAHDFGRAHNEWDLWLRLPCSGDELRLGAHADDITGKKKKFVYPDALLPEGVRILPYYTVDDEFSLLATAEVGT
ncbi:MAG: hypothetical protein M0026_16035 [Nocardiopsaceae bacterium]|nr:hypothetical protein [Nocardiopsaceae bacterium]